MGTLRSFRAKIRSCKVDNEWLIKPQERLVKAQERQGKVIFFIL